MVPDGGNSKILNGTYDYKIAHFKFHGKERKKHKLMIFGLP